MFIFYILLEHLLEHHEILIFFFVVVCFFLVILFYSSPGRFFKKWKEKNTFFLMLQPGNKKKSETISKFKEKRKFRVHVCLLQFVFCFSSLSSSSLFIVDSFLKLFKLFLSLSLSTKHIQRKRRNRKSIEKQTWNLIKFNNRNRHHRYHNMTWQFQFLSLCFLFM